MDTEKKIALITGGSRGIGLSIAESLAKQGAHIIICSRSKENLESASKALKKHNVEVLTITTRIALPPSVNQKTDINIL